MFDVGNMTALVVGNPRLPSTVTEQWGWSDIPHAEQEAAMVAEMLQAKALVGSQVSSFQTEIIMLLFHLYNVFLKNRAVDPSRRINP